MCADVVWTGSRTQTRCRSGRIVLGALALLIIVGGAACGSSAANQGWPLGSSITLNTQTFVVRHQEKNSGGLIGSNAIFRDRIYVGPAVTVARNVTQPDQSHRDELHIHLNDSSDARDQVLEQTNPGGLADVAWLEDLMPLPGTPYQTISHGKAVFDNGTAEADRATSYQIVILIPRGARYLRALILTFDWLDQGRNLTFAAAPQNSPH